MSSGIWKLLQGINFLAYLPLPQLPFTLMAPPVYASILLYGWKLTSGQTAVLIHSEQMGTRDIAAQ